MAIGTVLSLVHGLHIVVHDKPLVATVIGGVVPLGLSLPIVYAGYWTATQEFPPRYVLRLGQWTGLGATAMGLLIGTISVHQYLAGYPPDDAVFQLATAITGGTLAGFLMGSYDVQRRRRADRIEALQDATGTLVESKTKGDVCEKIVDLTATELNMPLSGVWLYDDETDCLEPVAITDEGRTAFDDYPTYEPGDGLTWRVYDRGKRAVYTDVYDEPERYNQKTIVRSEMILPLGTHGVLTIGSREPDSFDDVDVSTAQLLASTASAVLDRVANETQLRSKQAALESQNERLEEFASIVSHDLRNPLAIAQGNLEVATEACDHPSLTEIDAAHRRMELLITDLLELAKAGRVLETTDRTSLEAVATDAWRMVDTEDATLELPAETLPLTADTDRVRQLFENLFRNSIDHGGSDVTVRVDVLAEDAGFAVEDDGPGIPRDDRKRIFEAGYTTREDGTGLGLLTVRRIAEAHDWMVSVTESRAGGARFEIRTDDSP